MPKKILLADDSITIQKVVELTFSDGDYEVIAVNNGAKAIQKLSEMRPDIILSDIIMPEKNGYEVCEYVKSHPEFRNIPVVLLTGTFEPFDPDRADKAGCDAVVTKPFESQSLIHKVEELVNQSRAAAAPPPAAAPEPAAASPWADEEPAAPAFAPPPANEITDQFSTSGFTPHGKPGPATLHGARHGLNDYTGWFAGNPDMAGQYFGYDGPFPPFNDSLIHHYVFTVYALAVARAPLEGDFTGEAARRAIYEHILAEATHSGTYTLNRRLL